MMPITASTATHGWKINVAMSNVNIAQIAQITRLMNLSEKES
jgi:hypothetical protein